MSTRKMVDSFPILEYKNQIWIQISAGISPNLNLDLKRSLPNECEVSNAHSKGKKDLRKYQTTGDV
jgi:hypothetical protein